MSPKQRKSFIEYNPLRPTIQALQHRALNLKRAQVQVSRITTRIEQPSGRKSVPGMIPNITPTHGIILPPSESQAIGFVEFIERLTFSSGYSIDIEQDFADFIVSVPESDREDSYLLFSCSSRYILEIPAEPEISDTANLEWEKVLTVEFGSNQRLTTWKAKCNTDSMSEFTITISFSEIQSGIVAICDQLVGADADPVVQKSSENTTDEFSFELQLNNDILNDSLVYSLASTYSVGALGNDIYYYEANELFNFPEHLYIAVTDDLQGGTEDGLSWGYDGNPAPIGGIAIELRGVST